MIPPRGTVGILPCGVEDGTQKVCILLLCEHQRNEVFYLQVIAITLTPDLGCMAVSMEMNIVVCSYETDGANNGWHLCGPEDLY